MVASYFMSEVLGHLKKKIPSLANLHTNCSQHCLALASQHAVKGRGELIADRAERPAPAKESGGISTQYIYVSVITPLGGMLLVYRPEGGGSINRNIPTRGVIISL